MERKKKQTKNQKDTRNHTNCFTHRNTTSQGATAVNLSSASASTNDYIMDQHNPIVRFHSN